MRRHPEHVGNLVELVGRDRDSPGPSSDEVRDDVSLHDLWISGSEPELDKHFRTRSGEAFRNQDFP